MAEPQRDRDLGQQLEITIGLFGPRGVIKVMLEESERVAAQWRPQRVRFVSIAHDDPSGAEERFARLRDRIDAAVFPGPWWYDLARTDHWLTVPATHIALSGSALYAALLRASHLPEVDLRRVSVDSLAPEAVREAYAEIDLAADQVHCAGYSDPDSVAGFTAFHRDLLRSGESTLALTTILTVQRELTALGLPAHRISPTRATVRRALETAVLMGQGSRLGAHQIAMIAVQVVPVASARGAGSDYWQQELALTTQQQVLAEARRVEATVTRRSDSLLMVTTTYGGLEQLTDNLRTAPFARTVSGQLGVPIAVGLGSGQTARAAEANALSAVEESLAGGGRVAVYLDGGGARVELATTSDTSATTAEPRAEADQRAVRIVNRIAGHVAGGAEPAAGQQLVADVETVADALQVSDRTGRRMLKELVDAGLAWPLPPVRSTAGGRPRQQFRLLTEKISTDKINTEKINPDPRNEP